MEVICDANANQIRYPLHSQPGSPEITRTILERGFGNGRTGPEMSDMRFPRRRCVRRPHRTRKYQVPEVQILRPRESRLFQKAKEALLLFHNPNNTQACQINNLIRKQYDF